MLNTCSKVSQQLPTVSSPEQLVETKTVCVIAGEIEFISLLQVLLGYPEQRDDYMGQLQVKYLSIMKQHGVTDLGCSTRYINKLIEENVDDVHTLCSTRSTTTRSGDVHCSQESCRTWQSK